MRDLSLLIQRIISAKIEWVLVGDYAAVFHGVTQVNQSVELCLRFCEENLLRLQSALAGLHPVHRMTPQKLPLELAPGHCGHLKNLYLNTDLGNIDCLSEVLGVGGYEEVLRNSQPLHLSFGDCRVLNIDTLILAKEAMNRPHDQLTASQLRAIKERSKEI